MRVEIGAALHRDIPVIPILLDGSKIPAPEERAAKIEAAKARVNSGAVLAFGAAPRTAKATAAENEYFRSLLAQIPASELPKITALFQAMVDKAAK